MSPIRLGPNDYRRHRMSLDMEFSPAIGMHSGYLPGYPASHGCVRIPGNIAGQFFERVHIGTAVRVAGSAKYLTRVRKAIPAYF
jgi:lipoprotein-anchoring transpeptidase ErfK/SrfK